jgi:hypothetical protein
MSVLAHAGHWLVSVAGVVPVVLMAAWIGIATLRDRRRRRRAGGSK